jgi:hypothetical protein
MRHISQTVRFEGGPLDGVRWECRAPAPKMVVWQPGVGADRGVIAWPTAGGGGMGEWGTEPVGGSALRQVAPHHGQTGNSGGGALERPPVSYALDDADPHHPIYRPAPRASAPASDQTHGAERV